MMELLEPGVLIPWMLGMLFGIFVGATPGLTATMAVALIVPISYNLPSTAGLAMIIGVSFTAIFAGDIPATYLRIPGTPASAAATLDGHALAQQGRAGLALRLNLVSSCLGGLVGVLLLMWIAPQLASFALRFSHYEYFWLAICGLCLSAVVSGGPIRKAFLSAAFGLVLSTIGQDIISGRQRFVAGQTVLLDGLGFIPVMIGLFGLSEVLRHLHRSDDLSAAAIPAEPPTRWGEVIREWWRHKWTALKGALTGTGIGALPGAGADIAAWGAYGLARKTSHEPAAFGQGATEGVVAPTSANNAAVAAAWIPAVVFGIPGDSVTAIVLGAMLVYNLKPGPMVFEDGTGTVQAILMLALFTQLLLVPCGLAGIRAFGFMLRLPRHLILTGVLVFSVVGAYAMRNSLFDVWIMMLFGVVGFVMERWRFPLAPMILGLILGPRIEENLRTGLIKSGGDLAPFVVRPLSLVLVILIVVALSGPAVARAWRRARARGASVE